MTSSRPRDALLPERTAREATLARGVPIDDEARAVAESIWRDVVRDGERAIRFHAERLGDITAGAPLVLGRAHMEAALARVSPDVRGALTRARDRIATFARAQRRALTDVHVPVDGGHALLRYTPVARAGCYAPGGRHPLPSSVLMTAVTAREAGVREVVVASPRPHDVTLAACALAGVDAVLAIGGAQAIFALTRGVTSCAAVDVVVGPGNRFVSAAKALVAGRVRIDLPAGPSELLVVADATADPARVASDLIAQAEHDPHARPMLIALDRALVDPVRDALARALDGLATADVARAALRSGFSVVVEDRAQATRLANDLAAEHVALHVVDAASLSRAITHAGAIFVGDVAAEVFADYGIGPNHVLPTGGAARSYGALSVLDFVRAQPVLTLDTASPAIVEDTATLATVEGLVGHARAARARAAVTEESSAAEALQD